MAAPKVLVTDRLPEDAKKVLSGFDVFEKDADDKVLADCRALICWPSRAKPELLQKMKTLKMIQTISAGVDGLDFGSLTPGVLVFSNAGAFSDTVAEHAWGLLLGIAKGIHLRSAKSTPRALRGKTLLIVGAGGIGTEVARLAKSLGMRTIGVSRSFKARNTFDEAHSISSLGDAVSVADALVITLPLTRATEGIINYGLLSRAKENAIVVNVGRGETVDESGLVRWLRERPESRFATDVFWKQGGREVFSTKAWDLPNFAGTLHVSGTPIGEDLQGPKIAAATNVRRFFESGNALNRVEISEYLQKPRRPHRG
ncbi:MAG TPA: 2-hydroxyacid dehydrogenase [Nitrososphaerales archaeon]|nr:2-hydroxyacid dehydrogenase [Nitrososphaerales archaeon]